MSIFVKEPNLLNEPVGFDDKEYAPPITTPAPRSHLIPDDDDSVPEAGRIDRIDRSREDIDNTSSPEPAVTDER
jgi:hypothetical protein